jgi:hypothetical protein
VSVEDRVRTATEATAATVGEIRPLTLPPPGAAPARTHRRRRAWGVWLAPVTAALAVLVIAAILVAVRALPGAGHGPAPTPAGPGRVSTSLPRYGVVLSPPQYSGIHHNLSVIDTHTGKQVAQVKDPGTTDTWFEGVSGAADDRTFAVSAGSISEQSWYLLRIAPGSAQPAKLTRLAIPAQPGDTVISGIALSPDGRTLAVMEWCDSTWLCDQASRGTLRLYSVATGKTLRTWTWGMSDPENPVPGYSDWALIDENTVGLAWLAGGRTLAFTYYAHGQAPAVRTLDTTRPGNDLVAGSRRVFTLPSTGPDACSDAELTPDGQTVVCGTQVSGLSGCGSSKETLEVDEYSATTGKRESVLYQHTGRCTLDAVGSLEWVGPGPTVVVMVATRTGITPGNSIGVKSSVGLLAQGKLIPVLPSTLPLNQGPGTIAF